METRRGMTAKLARAVGWLTNRGQVRSPDAIGCNWSPPCIWQASQRLNSAPIPRGSRFALHYCRTPHTAHSLHP